MSYSYLVEQKVDALKEQNLNQAQKGKQEREIIKVIIQCCCNVEINYC